MITTLPITHPNVLGWVLLLFIILFPIISAFVSPKFFMSEIKDWTKLALEDVKKIKKSSDEIDQKFESELRNILAERGESQEDIDSAIQEIFDK